MKEPKRHYVEVCLTTEDGVQHLRCHGFLKRNSYLIKTEQIFQKGSEDFGMFIITVAHDELFNMIEHMNDMYKSFEILSEEESRWDTYKKIRSSDFLEEIGTFMFSLIPPSHEVDIQEFLGKANETTLSMLKTSDDFKSQYIKDTFMSFSEKMSDLNYLIGYFEGFERYEDCAFLVGIKKQIEDNFTQNGKL